MQAEPTTLTDRTEAQIGPRTNVRPLLTFFAILALIWPSAFALHGITVHVFWTIRQRNLSPGLLTSVIYWIVAYFFVR